MAKSCLGIDIGKDQMKLVLMKGENIVKTASVQMPEGLLKDGRIVSVETTGELIRKTMKENMICPLSSRQVKYLKVSDKNTYISFWSVGIFMHTISLYIF